MTTKRRTKTEDPAPRAAAIQVTADGPPGSVVPPCEPMTPGWLMGIRSRPETAAEHAARLGASAGQFNDQGHITGTLPPDAVPPPVPLVCPIGQAGWTANRNSEAWLTANADQFGGCSSFADAWRNQISLATMPLIDTSAATNFRRTWEGCSFLTSFALLNTSQVTNFDSAWRDCMSMTSFPVLDTSAGVNFSTTWNAMFALTAFPLLNLSSGTNFDFCWATSNALTPQSIENILVALDVGGQTGLSTDIGTSPMANWTAPALAAHASLLAKGWTITQIT
jgi:hypothetical protein